MKTYSILGACLVSLAVFSTAKATNLSFTEFISATAINSAVGGGSSPSPIGLAYAGDRFVGSANYPGGSQLYQTNLTGQNVQQFGTAIAAFGTNPGEIFVASSLGTGPFGSNQIYAGSENHNMIVEFSHDGSTQSTFVSGLNGSVRSIAFDPYGNYGNDMIVATHTGNIYKVDGSGSATLLANVGEDAEGLSFSDQAFGNQPAGTLFVCSEGSGSVRAISPLGTVTFVTHVDSAETIHFVPLNVGQSGNHVEGYYGVNFPNDVQFADAGQFTNYAGQAIVTGEVNHAVTLLTSGINGAITTSSLGSFAYQPEDSIFVTAESVQEHSVPDSGTTAALLGSAVLGLAALRRRFARA